MNNESDFGALFAAAGEEENQPAPVVYQPMMTQGGGDAPAAPAVAPLFLSAEIGTVNAYTVVVAFDSNISASNYATGVTIKVNTVSQTITSATRQANHAVVRYVIPVLWHGSGDTVTWEYTGGDYASELDSTPLETVTAQAVTNNIAWAALVDLQADAQSLGALSTWTDQSSNGRNFTQSGDARPTVADVGGYRTVYFDGFDWMLGGNFADDLASLGAMFVFDFDDSVVGGQSVIVSKEPGVYYDLGAGWQIIIAQIDTWDEAAEMWISVSNNAAPSTTKRLYTFEVTRSLAHVYLNGNNSAEVDDSGGPVADYGNSEPVRIGTNGHIQADPGISTLAGWLSSLMLFAPYPNATDRAALETRLGARYGLTVP